MTLCKEKSEIVDIACRKPKGIEIDAGRFCRMDTSKVKGQLVVDKHPNVIISSEGKYLTCLVGECCMKLIGESIIMALSLVSESQTVNREESINRSSVVFRIMFVHTTHLSFIAMHRII
jgi:hypothetical protein